MIRRLILAALCCGLLAAPLRAANWAVTWGNHMVLPSTAGVIVKEMSGVTYVGPTGGGTHSFIAAMENAKQDSPGTKGVLVRFDLSFDAVGKIIGISNITQVLINPILDFEGIAYSNAVRNSVFLSDEGTPGVREVSLATTSVLQNVTIPPVFANRVANRGFESLTRTQDATAMWTANEEALTVDGVEATAAAGTTVRLLNFAVAANTVTAGPQYAYQVEPIHGSSTVGAPQSGLSDLVVMPDGTLLSLERSVAVANPVFRNRIFEVGLAGATDVSVGMLANGLIGQSYTPTTKQLLFSGTADGASGQNLEGLTLGPRLPNGSWVLVGVVDDNPADSDFLSANTVVAFVATPHLTADFNGSAAADGADFLAWQRGLGKTVGAKLSEGDGDRDGDVDAADLQIWKAAVPAFAAAQTVPEPTGVSIAIASLAVLRGPSSKAIRPPTSGRGMSLRLSLAAWILASAAATAQTTNWSIDRVSVATMPAPNVDMVEETSCVTYLGPVGDAHRFISAEQNHGNIVRFDVTFTAGGGIASIANVVNMPIVDERDFEGIAYTNPDRNSVFMSEENTPGVREISLANGSQIQNVSIPSVFNTRVSNRGFESLTRTLDGTTMWTGNEEALTADGPASTATVGSMVRLLRLDVVGNVVTAGPQFAYQVAPIHSNMNPSRSGLCDLAIMPDGTLLSLERSAADGVFFNRIFELDFEEATDISVGSTATGLINHTNAYTPVAKQLLWSDTIGTVGRNLEGLGLGPRLPDGAWAMLGLVDEAAGGSTVISFRAEANASADFDGDGMIDGSDFLAWQLGLGATVGAMHSEGDADRDGDVDAADLDQWVAAQPAPIAQPTPEPVGAALLMPAAAWLAVVRRRLKSSAKSAGRAGEGNRTLA